MIQTLKECKRIAMNLAIIVLLTLIHLLFLYLARTGLDMISLGYSASLFLGALLVWAMFFIVATPHTTKRIAA